MKTKMINTIFLGLTLAVALIGCKKDDDLVPLPNPIVNEQELITTMKLTLIDSSDAANIRTATFRDPDGDGGVSYDLFDTIRLEPAKTWYVSILLLNETAAPIDTISNEVLEEANDHLICFSPGGNSATVLITDVDGNSFPIGLQSKWKTTSSGLGTMQIELKHQPGIKNGTCGVGETDIDILFPVKIQ
ncbi:MAG: hypothetical protein IT222_07995 [Crocinitomix sp.]|nr:hypothetical protein [Crocinitomix sp.]